MHTLFRASMAASALLLIAGGAVAAPRTATLEIENVSCAACAPLVKWVLSRVAGVSQITVVERAGTATATVTFDDEKVTAESLARATTNAGFRSTVKAVMGAQ